MYVVTTIALYSSIIDTKVRIKILQTFLLKTCYILLITNTKVLMCHSVQGIEQPEEDNDLRKLQLMELAKLNGTLREDLMPK